MQCKGRWRSNIFPGSGHRALSLPCHLSISVCTVFNNQCANYKFFFSRKKDSNTHSHTCSQSQERHRSAVRFVNGVLFCCCGRTSMRKKQFIHCWCTVVRFCRDRLRHNGPVRAGRNSAQIRIHASLHFNSQPLWSFLCALSIDAMHCALAGCRAPENASLRSGSTDWTPPSRRTSPPSAFFLFSFLPFSVLFVLRGVFFFHRLRCTHTADMRMHLCAHYIYCYYYSTLSTYYRWNGRDRERENRKKN